MIDEAPIDRLTELEIQKIKVSVDSLGIKSAAKLLGVSRLALVNCIAGMQVQNGTIALVRQNMTRLVNG